MVGLPVIGAAGIVIAAFFASDPDKQDDSNEKAYEDASLILQDLKRIVEEKDNQTQRPNDIIKEKDNQTQRLKDNEIHKPIEEVKKNDNKKQTEKKKLKPFHETDYSKILKLLYETFIRVPDNGPIQGDVMHGRQMASLCSTENKEELQKFELRSDHITNQADNNKFKAFIKRAKAFCLIYSSKSSS